jgi:hypothetical protein
MSSKRDCTDNFQPKTLSTLTQSMHHSRTQNQCSIPKTHTLRTFSNKFSSRTEHSSRRRNLAHNLSYLSRFLQVLH